MTSIIWVANFGAPVGMLNNRLRVYRAKRGDAKVGLLGRYTCEGVRLTACYRSSRRPITVY